MAKIFNPCNLYIFIWCLYSLQGTLYPTGSIVSRGLLLVAIILSLYYSIYAISHYKLPVFFKGLGLMLVMLLVYGTLLLIQNPEIITIRGAIISNFLYLKSILVSLLPVYAIYTFTKKGLLNEKSIQIWAIVLLAVVTLEYRQVQINDILNDPYGREEFTNNSGYLFLGILPLCLAFRRRPIMQYIYILFCFSMILFAMKRGAIIIAVVCLFFLLYNNFKSASRRTKIYIGLLSIGILVAGYYLVRYQLSNSIYFVTRINNTLEGDLSGRDIIYSTLWSSFKYDANLFQQLFGRGANGTVGIAGVYAHNDWLALLTDQGLLGVFIYLFYWICFVKNLMNIRKNKSIYNEAYIAIGIICITKFLESLFSMSFASISLCCSVALGYYLGVSQHDTSHKPKLIE